LPVNHFRDFFDANKKIVTRTTFSNARTGGKGDRDMRMRITRRIAKIASLTALFSILFLSVLATGKLASSPPLPQSEEKEKKKVINLAEVAEKEKNLPPDDVDGDDPPDNTPLPFGGSFPNQAFRRNELLSAESSAYRLSIPSPTPLSDFLALEDTGGFSPPDTHGAVGHDFLMVVMNNRVRVQSRAGNHLLTVRLEGFWSALEGIGNVFDPRVVYDPDKRRWIFIAVANRPDPKHPMLNSAILIGVSENSDPRGNWYCSLIDADPENEQNKVWADFPTIGFNKDWVVAQAKLNRTSDNSFAKSQILVFNKTELYKTDIYAGGAGVMKRFDDPDVNWVPAITYGQNNPDAPQDPNLNKLYLVRTGSDNEQGRGRLLIKWIGGAVGAEILSTETIVAQSQESWSQSPGDSDFAPQLGSSSKIATNDHRMQSVVYRDGSLWCAHTIFLPTNNPTRSSIQWWQIKPDGGVAQRGLVDEPDGRYFYAFPSLAVNRNEDVLIGYSRFSANQYASAYYSFRKGSDPLNIIREDTKLKEGEAPYYRPVGNRNRWGDYSSSVVDPTNDTDFWTVQEYAARPRSWNGNHLDRWGTWWGRILPPDSVPCRFELESTNVFGTPIGGFIGADGFTASVRVKPVGDCGTWETESNNWWIKVISGHTGSGNGMVTFNVEPWNWPVQRVGSLTIAGKTYTITQLGSCIGWLPETSGRFAAQGGSAAVNFIDPTPNCPISIATRVDWVKAEIAGNSFKYVVAPNKTTTPRTATLLISGYQYTISQAAGEADDLTLLTMPPEFDGSFEGVLSYTIGNKIYWIFPSAFHNFPGVLSNVGAAISFEGDRNNPTRIASTAPKLFLSFTPEEEAANKSDPDFYYGLFPFSAIDDGKEGVVIFYDKVKFDRKKDIVYGRTHVGIGIARVSANNPMVAVREPGLVFTGDDHRFGWQAVVRGNTLYVYAVQFGYIFSREVRVARVPLSKVADKSAYMAWDGSKWNQDINKASPIGIFGSDPSIAWNAFLGKFVAVISESQNRVMLSTAASPEGPWSPAELLLTGPPPKDPSRFNGRATLHPGFFTGLGRTMLLSYKQPLPPDRGFGFFGETRLARVEFNQPERTEESFDKLKGKKVMVALVFGQANSANHGEPKQSQMTAPQNVFCLNNGKLTKCVDPLPGASGADGSVWTRLGGRIIDEGLYDAVVFIPIGEAASEIARWAPGPAGDLHQRILDAALMVRSRGLEITHLLWHQGESDAGRTSRADYKARFEAMLENLRKNGIDAPIYVSVASRCYFTPPDPEIQLAQCELVDPAKGIFPGPNTDNLGNSFRYDDCHFSNAGLEEFARLWIEQLKPGRRIPACRQELSRSSAGRAIQR
jgi:hypothetical protein